MTKDEKSQREIRKIAYGLWMQEGQPEGRDREHWDAAKEIWAFRSHDHALAEDGDDSGEQKTASGKQAAPSASKDQGERRRPSRDRSMH